jgi:Fe2+ transport system protein B
MSLPIHESVNRQVKSSNNEGKAMLSPFTGLISFIAILLNFAFSVNFKVFWRSTKTVESFCREFLEGLLDTLIVLVDVTFSDFLVHDVEKGV